jgi:hypothetical protein
MTVLVWITEDSWQACVDAVQSLAPAGQDVTLLHVTDTAALEAAHGAFTALLGRSRVDPGAQLEAMAEDAAEQVLTAAAGGSAGPPSNCGYAAGPSTRWSARHAGRTCSCWPARAPRPGRRAWARRPVSWWITPPARCC